LKRCPERQGLKRTDRNHVTQDSIHLRYKKIFCPTTETWLADVSRPHQHPRNAAIGPLYSLVTSSSLRYYITGSHVMEDVHTYDSLLQSAIHLAGQSPSQTSKQSTADIGMPKFRLSPAVVEEERVNTPTGGTTPCRSVMSSTRDIVSSPSLGMVRLLRCGSVVILSKFE
jgi:hypothetical protein